MMSALNVVVFVSSLAVGGFYVVCRLNFLRLLEHRFPVVAFHWALAVLAFSAATHAWEGETDLQDIAALIASATWLITSWPSWGTSRTPHHVSRP